MVLLILLFLMILQFLLCIMILMNFSYLSEKSSNAPA